MIKNKTTKLLACIALAFALTAPVSAQMAPPQQPGGAQPDPISQLAQMVGLSGEQEADIRSLVDTTTPKLEAMQTKAQALQTELQENAGHDYDEAEIRRIGEELGEISGELNIQSTLMQAKIDAIFTAEQREELERQRQQQMQMQRQQQMQMQQQMQQQMQRQQQQQSTE